ncbi:MAG: nitrilase-related carbon-nitrogen hydrolase [Acidobacteriaceae bacterium]
MEFAGRVRDGMVALLALAATALLVYFGNGLEPRWPLMWLAPVPVLVYALRNSARRAAVVAFVAMLAGCLNLLGYFRILQIPLLAWFGDFGLVSLVFALGVLLTRALLRRGAVWSAWLALPVLCVSFEFVRNLWLWPHGSAGCLAYSQLNFLPFLQLASLTGPWGMSFVLLLFAAGAALGIHLWRTQRGQAVRVLGATAAVVVAVLVFGAVRLAGSQPGPMVRAGLVSSDISRGVRDPGEPAQALFEPYALVAGNLIARGAQVVVMPEDLAVIVDPNTAEADRIFQTVSDRGNAVLVIGMNHISGRVRYNEARIYAPGVAPRTYHKEHLLPPFENVFTPGTSRTALATSQGMWGVAICKDLDFTEPARSYGRAGVGLLLAPAWDFNVDAFWHGHIAVMRAVEDGFSLVRSARGGFMTVADDRGRVLAEARSNSAPFATLLATIPAGHDSTLFQLWGDWFGWVAVALLILLLARLAMGRRAS